MNKFTCKIDDDPIDERFKTYLKHKAVKFMPFHMLQSIFVSIAVFMAMGFSFHFMLCVLYFIFSVTGFVLTRRYLWCVPYFSILLTELPIINTILMKFVFEDEFILDNTTTIMITCIIICYQHLLY